MLNIHIRWIIRRDLEDVIEIEKDSFGSPWREDDFINCLQQRNIIGMVAEHDELIVGYMVYELNEDCIRLLNFAVNPQDRRGFVGGQMLNKLKGKLTPERRSEIVTEVSESNIPALMFFKSQGMIATDVMRGFYEESDDDAIAMKFIHGWDSVAV